MSQDDVAAMPTLYVGLTDLPLGERQIDLGDGIFLRGADATFMSSLLLVNTNEASQRTDVGPMSQGGLPPLPRPAFWQLGGERTRITAELVIPNTIHQTLSRRYALARFIGSVLRLWSNPAIRMQEPLIYPGCPR